MLARWQKAASPQVKRAVCLYGAVALTEFSFATYKAGQQAIEEHRAKQTKYQTEYEAVVKACLHDYEGGRTIRSVFWPLTWIRRAAPHVVLGLNPPPKPPSPL